MSSQPVFGDELSKYRDAAKKEWGQYVAVSPIQHNGVLAYGVGDPVPAGNVETYGYLKDNLVKKVESADAKSALGGHLASNPAHTLGGTSA